MSNSQAKFSENEEARPGDLLLHRQRRAQVLSLVPGGAVVVTEQGQYQILDLPDDSVQVGDSIVLSMSVTLLHVGSPMYYEPNGQPQKQLVESDTTLPVLEIRKALEERPALLAVAQNILRHAARRRQARRSSLIKALGKRRWQAFRNEAKSFGRVTGITVRELYVWHGQHPDPWAEPTNLLKEVAP